MNKREKIVQEAFINDEEAVIRRLGKVYNKALEDINKNAKDLQAQIEGLESLYDSIEDEKEKARLKSMKQSKVYQKQYQDAMKQQVSGILDTMQVEEFKTVSNYLDRCYEQGFLGTMYNLQGQGIPLIFPMDQEAIVRAVQLDSKISKGLYQRLGEDVSVLKKKVTATISRGISTGMRFEQMAKQLSGYTNIGYNNAVRIARTEGHRIQVQSTMDACYKAKDKGANIVKQWDSTLDGKTRDSHAKVDGEIRELDEVFSNGLRFPSDPHGAAAEVVNCRCALLQRAKWGLDEDELNTLKERAAFFEVDKNDNFEDFKKKYLKAAEVVKKQETTFEFVPAKTIQEAEEYAQKFVSGYKSKYSGNMSYKGMDLEYANKVNEVLTKTFDMYDIKPLANIKPMNFRESKWRGSTADAAYQWGGSGGTLYFNGNYYKSKKALQKHIDEADELLQRVIKGKDILLNNPKNSERQKIYIEALARTGRQCVAQSTEDFAEATFVHEIGHMLDDKVFALQTTARPIDIRKSMEQYAGKVSGYAATSSAEYVAESYTAWWYGMTDIIDPELVNIFERTKKK